MTAVRPNSPPPQPAMDATNKGGPVWAPELRQQLRRLEQLEARERRARRERWNVPLAMDPEPEGWLVSYLDLVTLMLVLLVVLLALSRQNALEAARAAPPAAALAAATPATAPPAEPAPVAGLPAEEAATSAPALLADTTATPEARPASAPAMVEARPATSSPPHTHPAAPPATDDTAAVSPGGLVAPASMEDLAHALAQATRDAAADGDPQPAAVAEALAIPGNAEFVGPPPPPEAFIGPPLPPVQLAGSSALAAATLTWPQTELPDFTLQLPALETSTNSAPSLEALGLTELGAGVDVIINEQSISLRISNEILFSSGQADLTASGLAVLDRVAAALARNSYRISVEGHTDPIPIQTQRYPSNWELSTTRATSVLRQLEARGIASTRLRATGYADTVPLADNRTPEGRAINRRVEVILETTPEQPASTR